MIFAGPRAEPSCFALGEASLVGVKLQQLVCAFTYLALLVEHEAAAKDVDFILVGHCCVALAALNTLGAREGDTLPDYLVAIDLGANDLVANVIIEATDHVHAESDRGQRGALPRCWDPLRLGR